MQIHSAKYIENGYFLIDYGSVKVMQDLTGIKMTIPDDVLIKEISLFLRSLKIDHLKNKGEFDDLKYRDVLVAETKVDHSDLEELGNFF